MFLLLFLITYISCDPLDCIGTGIDTTQPQAECLAKVYHLSNDQIFKTNIFASQLSKISIVMQSEFDIDAYYHEQTSSSGFLGFGSSSTEVYRYYQNYYYEEKSLTKIILTIAFTKWTVPIEFVDYVLDEKFAETIKSLPPYHSNNSLIYDEIISTWGTAVLYEITTGGKFETDLWYDNMINNYYNEETINEYSGWSFMGIIGSGHGSSSDNIHVDKKFNASMSMKYYYFGGNITMSPNQYLDWAETVENNQQIIKYELIPITYFVKNKTAANYLDLAIKDYSLKSVNKLDEYIQSLKN